VAHNLALAADRGRKRFHEIATRTREKRAFDEGLLDPDIEAEIRPAILY
jgi:hypothetical protein